VEKKLENREPFTDEVQKMMARQVQMNSDGRRDVRREQRIDLAMIYLGVRYKVG